MTVSQVHKANNITIVEAILETAECGDHGLC